MFCCNLLADHYYSGNQQKHTRWQFHLIQRTRQLFSYCSWCFNEATCVLLINQEYHFVALILSLFFFLLHLLPFPEIIRCTVTFTLHELGSRRSLAWNKLQRSMINSSLRDDRDKFELESFEPCIITGTLKKLLYVTFKDIIFLVF